MEYGHTHLPVILLLEKGASANADYVRSWLHESRFLTCEAVDAFDALEELSDFTVRERPDVIILNDDPSGNQGEFLRELVQTAPGERDPAIISMSEICQMTGQDDFYARDLGQVAARLEKLIPSCAGMAN